MKRMTEEGTSLPDEMRNHVEAGRKKAYEAETTELEQRIDSEIEEHLAERRRQIENLIESKKREVAEAREREMAELREFEIRTLQALETELHQRRNERIKGEEEARNKRQDAEQHVEKPPQTETGESTTAQPKESAAPSGESADKIGKILKQAHRFIEQDDLELAEKAVAEGLAIDAFNAELIDLDAKIREQISSDTFARSGDVPGKESGEEKKKPAPGKADSPAEARKGFKLPKIPVKFLIITVVIVAIGLGIIVSLKYVPTTLMSRSTLAVLPWTAPANNEELQLFASTLPEQTVKLLARARSPVHLIGYTTTMNIAGMDSEPVRSLVQLGYTQIVRGQISLKDSQIVARVWLTDSAGSTLWSHEYESSRDRIMRIPYEIVRDLGEYVESDSSLPQPGTVKLGNPEAWLPYLRGTRALHLADDSGVDEAITSFSRSVSIDSTLGAASAGLATALTLKYRSTPFGAEGILDDAEQSADLAILKNPDISDGFLAKARVLIEKRDYENAAAMLDSARRRSPRESLIPYLVGMIELRQGMSIQAMESLQEAYLLDPRNTDILKLMALIQLFNGSYERAMWYHETAMYFSSDTGLYVIGPMADVIMLDPTLTLAQSQRVISDCLERLNLNPNDQYTLYRLARMLQLIGKIPESATYFAGLEKILREAIRVRPTDTRSRLFLGLTLTKLGRFDEAVSIGEAALRADPSNAEAKYLLARIYALQMYSPKTRSIDAEKQARCFEILREAIAQRFMEDQLGNADLYNVYAHTDIWTIFKSREETAQ